MPDLATKTVPAGKRLIISIHIPKTGGTAFADILKNIAQEFFCMDYGPQSFSPTAVYRRGELLRESLETFTSDELLAARNVIHGHFRAGKYLERFPNANYVTWLRDPVERTLSHYSYWQRTPLKDDPLWLKVVPAKLSLEEFAQLDFACNVAQRFTSPLSIEDFAFVGITEEFERSLELFRRLICPDMEFGPIVRNSNPERVAKFYDLEPALRRRILKLNELDAYLYLDGLRRFRRLCEQMGI